MGAASAKVSGSVDETEAAAADLSKQLKAGDLIHVCGDVGAGKTTFIRGACTTPDAAWPDCDVDVGLCLAGVVDPPAGAPLRPASGSTY